MRQQFFLIANIDMQTTERETKIINIAKAEHTSLQNKVPPLLTLKKLAGLSTDK